MAVKKFTNVYRTDLEEEVYVGFFISEDGADQWIGEQSEGDYEKR